MPSEGGPVPPQIRFINVMRRTESPNVFQNWIMDLESALATAGWSLVRHNQGNRTIYQAGGRTVAESSQLARAFTGVLYAMPDPALVGQVGAQELERAGWMGYGGYGQGIRAVYTPEQQAARAAAREIVVSAEQTAALVRLSESRVLDEMTLADTSNPNNYEEVRPSMGLGIGLAAVGALGGVALLTLGGKLATGIKVAGGAAALATVGGGALLAARKEQVLKKEEDLPRNKLSTKFSRPAPVGSVTSFVPVQHTASDKEIMALTGTFDNPEAAPRYSCLPKYHPKLAAEAMFVSRSHDVLPNVDIHVDIPKGIASPFQIGDHRAILPTKGLSVPAPPRDSNGKPLWAEIGKVVSNSVDKDVCPSDWMLRDPMWDGTSKCYRLDGLNTFGIRRNETIIYAADGTTEICRVRHWRYKGDRNHGWYSCYEPNDLRKCCGSSSRPLQSSSDQFKWVVWAPGYENFNGSGKPPLGFYMPLDNSYLQAVYSQNPLDTVAAGWDSDIRGPMMGIATAFKVLRGASPEVSMIYWDSVESIFHLVVEYAQQHQDLGGWGAVGRVVGTVLGIASFVCEIATPIVTCINPAFGAALGTATRVVGGASSILGAVIDPTTGERTGGVLDAIGAARDLAPDLFGAIVDAPAIKQKLDEGWTQVKSLADDVMDMADGYWSLKGIVGTDVWDPIKQTYVDFKSLDPFGQYSEILGRTFHFASQNVQSAINDVLTMPFKVEKITGYTLASPQVEALDVRDFLIDPWETYRESI